MSKEILNRVAIALEIASKEVTPDCQLARKKGGVYLMTRDQLRDFVRRCYKVALGSLKDL